MVEQIQNRLILSFTDPEINISEILMESGYTKDYMRRRFCAEIGMTPGEYLTELRIRYARQLLDQKSHLQLSISSISMMCGYYDVHYFSRIFRRKTGLSPREYIKSHEQNMPEDYIDGEKGDF